MLVLIALAFAAPADTVIEHATLWSDGKTMKDTCIAIRDGRFVSVGRRDASLIGPETKVVDAKGAFVMPGVIDSHMHLMRGGIRLHYLRLDKANTKTEFLEQIKAYADKQPAEGWVIGSGWSAESWPEKVQPNREMLDSVTGDRPAALTRMDGHSVLLNSKALKLMGIDKNGPANPNGGSIDRDVAGEPTGLLRETAMGLLRLPPSTPEQVYRGFQDAVKMANSMGITAAGEIGSWIDNDSYRRYAQGEPTIRLGLFPVATNWTNEIQAMKSFRGVPGWVAGRGVKGYMDGTLGSRTAFMFEPFSKLLPDQTSPTGLPRAGFRDGSYAKGVKAAAEANLQVLFHAIGDRANSEVLNMYDANAPGLSRRRFRIEHAQHLAPADIPRFGKLGVIASLQPYHKADDGRYCEEIIGTERSRTSYAYRDLLKTGARLAFGSDWPVVTANPWLGIETAVTGRIMTGAIWMPHQNITVDEALQAYTSGGAYAMGMEGEIGQVRVGFRADLLILNESPFAESPSWKTMHPERVWVEGRELSITNMREEAKGGAPDDCCVSRPQK